jgi:hypothetical protein
MVGTEQSSSTRAPLAAVALTAVAVAGAIAAYAAVHTPALRPLFLLGFSGMLQMKAWLATTALVLIVVQVLSALAMWGRLPGVTHAPSWVGPVHRWSGALAFAVTVPVAVHCVWSLGFVTTTPRVLWHSVFGCAFYGAYAAKMVGLRLRGTPGWLLPVLGALTFTLFALVWLTSALWFFTRSGLPLT